MNQRMPQQPSNEDFSKSPKPLMTNINIQNIGKNAASLIQYQNPGQIPILIGLLNDDLNMSQNTIIQLQTIQSPTISPNYNMLIPANIVHIQQLSPNPPQNLNFQTNIQSPDRMIKQNSQQSPNITSKIPQPVQMFPNSPTTQNSKKSPKMKANPQIQNLNYQMPQGIIPNIMQSKTSLSPNYQIPSQHPTVLLGSNYPNQMATTTPQIQPNPVPVPISKPEFEIEGIVQEREVRGKRQYLVQWEGFSDDENTWEDEANLGLYCHLVNEFRQKGPHQRQPKQRIKDFIYAYKKDGKIFYNVLYQNLDVGTLTEFQAHGSRYKQQLINYLLREVEKSIEEKDRVELPSRPKLARSKNKESKKEGSQVEYEYETVYEEEEEEEEKNEK